MATCPERNDLPANDKRNEMNPITVYRYFGIYLMVEETGIPQLRNPPVKTARQAIATNGSRNSKSRK